MAAGRQDMSLEHSFATEAPTQKPVTKGDEKVELLFDVGGTIFAIERHLIDRWPTSLLSELLVLEGSSERIGGRIHTKLFEATSSLPPVRVDLGASYLHGYEFEPDDDKNSYDAMMLDGYGEVQPARLFY